MVQSQEPTQDDASANRSISDDEATEVDATINNNPMSSVFARDPFQVMGMLTAPHNLEEYEQSRREDLMDELDRVHRHNLIQFGALCLIPCALLIMIMMSSFSDKDVGCTGIDGAECKYETRVFMNAFARRCICDAFTTRSD
jgi:hypothetical protein